MQTRLATTAVPIFVHILQPVVAVTLFSVLVGLAGCAGTANRPLQFISGSTAEYPAGARERGIEGWVDVVYDVAADGTVANPRVADSEPDDVFDAAALAAIREWRFEPRHEDGEPVAVRGLESRVAFRLGEPEDYDEL